VLLVVDDVVVVLAVVVVVLVLVFVLVLVLVVLATHLLVAFLWALKSHIGGGFVFFDTGGIAMGREGSITSERQAPTAP
jgi:hypothetical protein